MAYTHMMYRPHAVGQRVEIVAQYSAVRGHLGCISRVDPEDDLDGEDCTYYVTLDGETEAYLSPFSYWGVQPVEEEEDLVPA